MRIAVDEKLGDSASGVSNEDRELKVADSAGVAAGRTGRLTGVCQLIRANSLR